MPADGPPTRADGDVEETRQSDAAASPAGVDLELDDKKGGGSSESMSSEAKSDQLEEKSEKDRAAHVAKLRDTWETVAKAELQAVIDDAGAYAGEEIQARINRAKDLRDGLKVNGVAETDLTLKLMEKTLKRAEAAAKEQAEQVEDGSAKFISLDKAGASGVFDASEDQIQRYNNLRQKTENISTFAGLTVEEAADKIEVSLPLCCMGHRWFVYVLAGIIMVVPIVMCSFMMNATYTAYYNHHICTGPELTGGVLQSIWFMAFIWILTWILLKGCLKGERGTDAEWMNICAIFPFIAISVGVGTIFVALFTYHSSTAGGQDGDAIVGLWIGVVGLLTIIQLVMVCLWPFLGPIIFLSVILNLDTRTEYYKFDLYYGNDVVALNSSGALNRTELSQLNLATRHILETSPVGMDNWPSQDDPDLDSVIKSLFEFPGLEIVNNTRVGGWPKEPPNGIAGLVDGVLMREAGWCATSGTALPDFIDFLYQKVGDSSNPQGVYSNYKLPGAGGYDNCTEMFWYNATPSANNEFYDVKGMPATYCQDGATMPECCDIVTNLAASSTVVSVVLCIIGMLVTLSMHDKQGKSNPLIGMCPLFISLPSLALGWLVYNKV